MAVTSVKRLFSGQTASISPEQRSYVEVFLVQVNDPTDDQLTVSGATDPTTGLRIPLLGYYYQGPKTADPDATLKSIGPSRVEGTRQAWLVQCNYETPRNAGNRGGQFEDSSDGPQPNDQGVITDNPFDWRDRVEFSNTIFGSPVTDAIIRSSILTGLMPTRPINSRGPVQVASGEVIDPPPEIDDASGVLRITKFEDSWAKSAAYPKPVINSDPIDVRLPGFVRTIDRYCAKLYPCNGSLLWHTTQSNAVIPYWQNQYEVALTDREDGWRIKELNRGYNRRYQPGDDDGNGGSVPSDYRTTAKNKGLALMKRLTDADGNPIGPLLLDEDGKPLIDGPPIYITYSGYEEVEMSGLALWS